MDNDDDHARGLVNQTRIDHLIQKMDELVKKIESLEADVKKLEIYKAEIRGAIFAYATIAGIVGAVVWRGVLWIIDKFPPVN